MKNPSPFSKIGLFWDVDRTMLNARQHQKFIIERILGRGDVEDFLWAREQYGVEALKQVFLTARTLNPKSISFWSHYFHIDPKFSSHMPAIAKQGAFWQR